MKTYRRLAWLLVLLGSGLFTGILFRDFLLTNIIVPVAVLLRLLWQVVQSVDQALYWGWLILAAGCLAFYRLAQALNTGGADVSAAPESVLKNVSHWRTFIVENSSEGDTSTTLTRDLAKLLATVYASKTPEATPVGLYEALRRREMPLPARIYAFLFPEETQVAKRSWKLRLQQLAESPRRWLRRWTGRDRAQYYQAIEETLTFMEALMEIRHGDDYFDPSHH